MNLTVEPHIFDRLALGWLIVPGTCECRSCLYGNPNHTPPADLVALVGKACWLCKGTKRHCLNPDDRYCDGDHTCPDCLGSGSALLTVTTDACEYNKAEQWCEVHDRRMADCPDGTRSVRVHLTGQPLPILEYVDDRPDSCDLVEVRGLNGPARWAQGNDLAPVDDLIDLGLNPADLIGCWAFPVEVVT
jgi:hypothetical protein